MIMMMVMMLVAISPHCYKYRDTLITGGPWLGRLLIAGNYVKSYPGRAYQLSKPEEGHWLVG